MTTPGGSIADAYNSVAALAPKLAQRNPGATMALAQAHSAGVLNGGVLQSTAAFNAAVTLEGDLRTQPPDVQAEMFARLNDGDKNLLAQIGYAVPTAAQPQQQAHRGFFGSIGHFFGQGVSDVTSILNAGQRAVQHAVRTILVEPGYGGTANPAGQFKNLLTPSRWVSAWNQTSNGKLSYDQGLLDKAQQTYDPQVYDLAKQLNDGLSIDQIAPTLEAKQQAHELAARPDFAKAMSDVDHAHLSFGRQAVKYLGVDPRVKVGPIRGNAISGLLDGTLDVVSDPTLQGGKVLKGVQIARYGLVGADSARVAQVFTRPSVQAAWGDIADQLKTIREGAGSTEAAAANQRILDAYPAAGPLIGPMLDAGVHDVATAQEFLESSAGLARLLVGQPAREVPLMPHALSPVGEALVASKKALRSVIDWRKVGPKMLPSPDLSAEFGEKIAAQRSGIVVGAPARMALVVRRLTNRVPIAEYFSPLSDNAGDVMRRTGLAFLPTYHVNQLVSAFHAADLGGKRTIYKAMLGQLLHASGATSSVAGRQYYGQLMDDLEQWTTHRAYTTTEAGYRPTEAGTRELGFLANHFSDTWALPSFRGMVEVAGRFGVLDRIGGAINRPAIDKAMRFWRWQVLTRPGFGLRAAGDEILGATFRGGGRGLVRAFAATRALGEGKPTAWDPAVGLARVVGKVIKAGGGEDAAASINNAADLAHKWSLGLAGSLLRYGSKYVAGKDYMRYAGILSQDPLWQQAMAELLHASRFNDIRYDGSDLADIASQGFKADPVRWLSNNEWDTRTAEGWEGSVRWAHELEKLVHDPAGGVAARAIAEEALDTRAVDLVKEKLASGDYAALRKKAEIADITRDGRRVSTGEATQDEALHDWAQDIYDHAVSLLSEEGKDGERVLARPVLTHIVENGDSPGASMLATQAVRPSKVVGKQYFAVAPPTGWDKFSDKAFDVLARRPLNFLSRQPLTTHHYVQARQILAGHERQLLNAGHGKEAVEDLIHRQAIQRAVEHTAFYVHNPRMRTQMSVVARNLFPFRHAEEGFYTRWARTVRDSPHAVRKAQLTFQAMQHTGMTQNDDQGRPVFVYPATGFVYDAIARAHNLIPGLANIPIFKGVHPNFTSPVYYLNPGLTQLASGHIYPQGGPLATLSMGVIRRMFPEAELPRQAERVVAGEQGAGKPLWGQFVPTVLSRLYGAWGDQSDSQGQLASAARSAIAYLDAIGQAPPPDANAGQVDHYLNQVKSMSRTLLTMRTALGFLAPAAPSAPEFDRAPDPEYAAEGVRNMRSEFVELTKKMPYDQALADFQELHPDDSPFKGGSFLVSQSDGDSQLFLPSTKAALDWMASNSQFLKDYKLAGPLLIPDDPGEFNYDAFREQLSLGVRQRKSIQDFYRDVKIQTAERQYYGVRDQRDQLLADARATNNSAQVQNIQHKWDTWSQELLAVNPLFAEWLSQGSQRAQQRSATMDEIAKLTSDPNAPVPPELRNSLNQVAAAWTAQQSYLKALSGYTTSAAVQARKAVRAQFDAITRQAVAQQPRLIDLYNHVLRPMEG